MLIKWIYPESEEVLGIKRNKGDIFEIGDDTAKQIESQGKGLILAKKQANIEVPEIKETKSKGKGK